MKNTEVLSLIDYNVYKSFLEECRKKVYSDNTVLHKHHIIPKCIDPTIPNKTNLIKISVEDHITAHLLLAKCFTEGSYERLSNIRAAKILSKGSIKDKEVLTEVYKFSKGELNSFYGKKHSEETKQKLREATIKTRTNVSYNDFYGSRADIEKQKRSLSVTKVWELRSEDEKKLIKEKIKNKKMLFDYTGSKNPNAKCIIVDGIKFESVIDAQKKLNKSRYKLFKEHKIEF